MCACVQAACVYYRFTTVQSQSLTAVSYHILVCTLYLTCSFCSSIRSPTLLQIPCPNSCIAPTPCPPAGGGGMRPRSVPSPTPRVGVAAGPVRRWWSLFTGVRGAPHDRSRTVRAGTGPDCLCRGYRGNDGRPRVPQRRSSNDVVLVIFVMT